MGTLSDNWDSKNLLPEMGSFAPSTIGITDADFKIDSLFFFIDDKPFSLEVLLVLFLLEMLVKDVHLGHFLLCGTPTHRAI